MKFAFRFALLFCAALACAGAAADPGLEELARQAASGSAGARAEIERRAGKGEMLAEHLMGMMYVSGRGLAQDDEAAIEWFLRAATKGHAPSQHNLGVIFERTANAALKDPVDARRWYLAAAEQGYARSQAKIGAFYLDGIGFPSDTDRGRAWLEKAAAQGEPYARYRLGLLYLEGRGVDTDLEKGAQLLTQAAEARDGNAQYQLALLYREGRGVPKDDAQALYWLRSASENRQAEAEYLLAIAYRHGWLNAPRNPKLSLHLLQRSALQGHAPAQFELGLAFIDGRLVKPDPQEAYGWLQRAARQGHAPAVEYVRRIEDEVRKRKPQ